MRPARRREAVDRIRATWRVSIRRACSVLQAERSSYHYKGKRRPQAVLNKRIKEIAETRVRYGYRRIHVLLRREGWRVNARRVWRLYREMGLQLRSKTPKRKRDVAAAGHYAAIACEPAPLHFQGSSSSIFVFG